MKTAVIYNSKTGFTEKYAMWLTERLGADCYRLAEAKTIDFDRYDAIIFGGWVCAGKVSKVKWFFDRIPTWKDKCLVLYAVGGSPRENPDIDVFLESVIPSEYHNVKAFYCQGGYNYEKMDAPSRLAMKMFAKMLKSGKEQTEEEKIMADMISKSYDISDPKYIEPIVEYVENSLRTADEMTQ